MSLDFSGAGVLLSDGESHPDSLERLDGSIRILEDEFRFLANDIKTEAVSAQKLYICLDFDVIYTALNGNDARRTDHWWSALCIDAYDAQIVLLPGTAFELSKYMARQYHAIAKRQTTLAFALERALGERSIRDDHIRSPFTDFISDFKGHKFQSDASFVLSMVQDRLVDYKRNWPVDVDQKTFYYAIYEHARHGFRVDKDLNNKVDAYNYSLVNSLNQYGNPKGERFVLVTNSPVLQGLSRGYGRHQGPRDASATPEPAQVWSARYAAIRQLLMLAAGGSAGAYRFAWSIVERLVTYRSWVSRKLAAGPVSAMDQGAQVSPRTKERPDDLFVDLVTSIDTLRDQIEQVQSKANYARSEFGASIPRDPKGLNALVRRTLGRFRDNDSFDSLVVSAAHDVHGGKVTLSVKADRDVSEDGFLEAVLRTGDDAIAAVCYASPQFYGAYARSIASLEEFLLVWNRVSLRVFADHTAGKIVGEPKSRFAATVGTVGEDSIRTIPSHELDANLDTLKISQLAGCTPGEISFLRIDTPLFDASFERVEASDVTAYVTFLSHLDLASYMASYLKELNEPGFSNIDETLYYRELRNFRKFNEQRRRTT